MRNKNFSKNNQGFTLIELLIVIIIIGILATASFVYLNPTQWTARGNDTKRLSDLKNIHDTLLREIAQGNVQLSTAVGEYNSRAQNASSSTQSGFVKFIPANNDVNYKLGGFPVMPVDPKNTATAAITYDYLKTDGSTGKAKAFPVYKFCISASGFEINSLLEADKDKMAKDGGNQAWAYEIGTDLNACTSEFASDATTQ